jgi:hypothetical protein
MQVILRNGAFQSCSSVSSFMQLKGYIWLKFMREMRQNIIAVKVSDSFREWGWGSYFGHSFEAKSSFLCYNTMSYCIFLLMILMHPSTTRLETECSSEVLVTICVTLCCYDLQDNSINYTGDLNVMFNHMFHVDCIIQSVKIGSTIGCFYFRKKIRAPPYVDDKRNKLRGLTPRVNYTDREQKILVLYHTSATAPCSEHFYAQW